MYGLILMQPHTLSSWKILLTEVIAKSDPCGYLFIYFFRFKPPSCLDIKSLWIPLPREFPDSHPSGGGGFFYRNNPIFKDVTVISVADLASLLRSLVKVSQRIAFRRLVIKEICLTFCFTLFSSVNNICRSLKIKIKHWTHRTFIPATIRPFWVPRPFPELVQNPLQATVNFNFRLTNQPSQVFFLGNPSPCQTWA